MLAQAFTFDDITYRLYPLHRSESGRPDAYGHGPLRCYSGGGSGSSTAGLFALICIRAL